MQEPLFALGGLVTVLILNGIVCRAHLDALPGKRLDGEAQEERNGKNK
jgi:hypothetical protein